MTEQPTDNRATRRAAAKTSSTAKKPPARQKKTAAAAAAIMGPAHEPVDLSDVGLNLDTLEREGSKGPFVFLHDGRKYTMIDPYEIDWKDLVDALTNPFLFLKNCMSTVDAEAFLSTRCPTWKMNAIVDAYLRHHGLPTAGELGALPRS